MSCLYSFDHVSHRYGSILALDNLSCQFSEGSMTAIFGPNGGGKSTLLKIMAGLMPPSSGHLRRGGVTSSTLAYLPQCKDIDKTFPLLVEDVVAMGLWSQIGFFKGILSQNLSLIDKTLTQVGLEGFNKRSLTELSGGQFQRMLFARLMIQNATTILLDEPFVGIDSKTIADLLKIIEKWHGEKKTIFIVLHDLAMIQKKFPHSLLIARQLIAMGETDIVLTTENLAKAAFYV